ncbi:hypothetical protein C8Q77DRAFT_1114183 [Trametes polyzona]|nr:hypothetical protein C8Q77DRAFT_1114183 [Trametes polyzona]
MAYVAQRVMVCINDFSCYDDVPTGSHVDKLRAAFLKCYRCASRAFRRRWLPCEACAKEASDYVRAIRIERYFMLSPALSVQAGCSLQRDCYRATWPPRLQLHSTLCPYRTHFYRMLEHPPYVRHCEYSHARCILRNISRLTRGAHRTWPRAKHRIYPILIIYRQWPIDAVFPNMLHMSKPPALPTLNGYRASLSDIRTSVS